MTVYVITSLGSADETDELVVQAQMYTKFWPGEETYRGGEPTYGGLGMEYGHGHPPTVFFRNDMDDALGDVIRMQEPPPPSR